uniref:Knottins-like domain-containing protein n=1 Tax=Heliothis virescens TaxID=7102 RepID=A0A2A4JSR7_HELVI
MLPKILIFVLATVTVINATVIVNVLDDDPEIGLLSAKSDCNPTECDQRCRRLKFPGGACVNGRCKCDNFRYIEEFSDNSIPTAEDFSPLQDDLASELAGKKSDCNPSECDQRCRRLKFPGGACVNGRCKCDNFRNAGEELSDNSIPTAEDVSDCSPLGCDQQCRRIGFPGGVCVNGRCKCDILRNTQDHYEVDPAIKYNDCSPLGCDQQCRRIGFPGGVCVNGRCKCDILRDKRVQEQSLPEPRFLGIFDKLRCNSDVCNKYCGKIGLSGGICKKGICKCNVM